MGIWDDLQSLPENFKLEELPQIYLIYQFPIEIRSIFADWIEKQSWEFNEHEPDILSANVLLATLLDMIGEHKPQSGNILDQAHFKKAKEAFLSTYENDAQLFVRNVYNMIRREKELLIQSQFNDWVRNGYWDALQSLQEFYKINELPEIYLQRHFPIDIRCKLARWIERQNWNIDEVEVDINKACELHTEFIRRLKVFNPQSEDSVTNLRFESNKSAFLGRFENNPQLFVRTVREMLEDEKDLLMKSLRFTSDLPGTPYMHTFLRRHGLLPSFEAKYREYLSKREYYDDLALKAGITIAISGAAFTAVPGFLYLIGVTSAAIAKGSIAATLYGGATGGVFSAFHAASLAGATMVTKASCAAVATAASWYYWLSGKEDDQNADENDGNNDNAQNLELDQIEESQQNDDNLQLLENQENVEDQRNNLNAENSSTVNETYQCENNFSENNIPNQPNEMEEHELEVAFNLKMISLAKEKEKMNSDQINSTNSFEIPIEDKRNNNNQFNEKIVAQVESQSNCMESQSNQNPDVENANNDLLNEGSTFSDAVQPAD